MFGFRGLLVLTVTLASFAALTSEARADYVVRFDCYLAHSDLSCADVRSALGGAIPGARLVPRGDSALSIELRDLEAGQGRRYYARFTGRPIGSDEELSFRISREVPHASGHDRALPLVVALVQRGVVPFLQVDQPGEVEDGQLTLAGRPGEVEDDSQPSRWYFRPTLSGGYFGGNLTSVSAVFGLGINYSDPEWRWRLEGEGRYRYLDIDLPGASLRGDYVQVRGETVVARSLVDGLSLAIPLEALREPQNNLDLRARAGLGLEWVLSPFLAANETNLGGRIVGSGVYDAYATPNLESNLERGYFESRLELFGRVHTEPVDFELSGGLALLPEAPELWSTWGSLETTIRVADGFSIGVAAAVLYRAGAIHAPLAPDQLNPIAATTGSSFGELTLTTELSLSWTVGNSLLRSQDQRWQ